MEQSPFCRFESCHSNWQCSYLECFPESGRSFGLPYDMDNNERFTLKSDVDRIKHLLGVEFTLDVAACEQSHIHSNFFDKEDNGLDQPWEGHVWCNPPFDDIGTWVDKAWREWRLGRCNSITMLVPANRCEQVWWQLHVEPYRDQRMGQYSVLWTHFLSKRLKFGTPEDPEGKRKGNAPPFGCVVLHWR